MWHSHDQTKMNRITSVPDEFALETRLVVLNFMGLMPASCPPTALVDWPPEHSGHRLSLNSQCSSLLYQDDAHMKPSISQSNLTEASELGMKISEDQSLEPCTLIRKGMYIRLLTTGDLSSSSAGLLHSLSVVESGSSAANGGPQTSANLQDLYLDAPSLSIIPASPPEAPENHSSQHGADMSLSVPQYLGSRKILMNSGDATEDSICKSLDGNESKRSSIVSSHLSPHQEGAYASVDRQHSLQSCLSGSSRSLVSMRQNSYVDVRHVDVETLIRNQTLSPVAVSLKEEISKGLVDLEKSYARAKTEKLPLPAAPMEIVSPESQVADMLRAIGDRVQDDYIVYLNDATDQLLQHQNDGQLTYGALQETAVNLLHHSSAGWTQVALVLLMSQRLSLILLAQGDRSVGRLAEYTSRFITDHIADFILSRGGWQSISEIGVTETPLSLSQDILPSASSTDTDLDPVESVQASAAQDAGTADRCRAADTLQQQTGKISNNKDISLNGVKCCSLQTVSLPADEDLTCPLNDGEGDKCLMDNNKDILYSDVRVSICESETVDESSVLESFLLMESDELKVGLICGVIAVTLLGTWIVYNRVKRG